MHLGITGWWNLIAHEYPWADCFPMRSSGFVCILYPRRPFFSIYTFFKKTPQISAHTAEPSSNASFSFSLCVLFKRQWNAFISTERAWQAVAQGRLVTRDYSRIPAPEKKKTKKKTCLYWLYFWSNPDDWQDIAVWAKWSIIRHMARWEHPEFILPDVIFFFILFFFYSSQVNFWTIIAWSLIPVMMIKSPQEQNLLLCG